QRLYQPANNLAGTLPLFPEWYLGTAILATLSLLSVVWKPLLATVPLLVLAAGLSLVRATVNATNAPVLHREKTATSKVKVLGIIIILDLMQPLARLCGRFRCGLHPWRDRGAPPQVVLRCKTVSIWTETWRPPEEWLGHLQSQLRLEGTVGFAGGGYDD